jgi:radical SAM superfamily enzyme YgiQ (UPF0313 family)
MLSPSTEAPAGAIAEATRQPGSPLAEPRVGLIRSPGLVNTFALSNVVAPPLGLAYIAGSLRAAGIKSTIVDSTGLDLDRLTKLDYAECLSIGLPMNEAVARLPENADVIGVSCMFSSSWPYDRRMIGLIRERFPHAWIVVGGEHVTACADWILENYGDVDACVLGEGEETFVELIRTLRAGGDLADVAGIAYRRDGKVVTNPRRSRIKDIDAIPLPDWTEIPIENYMDRGLGHGCTNTRSMPLMASRGCPYQCTFCSSPQMWTTRWYARKPSDVVDEMETYIERYGAENFDLYDLTAILRKDWILEFCDLILKRGLNITFQLPSGTRSEALDDEVLTAMKSAGCHAINYAPESGSPTTLKAIKKRVTLEKMEASMRTAAKLDLKVMVNVVLFPMDTPKTVRETFGFMFRSARAGVHDMTFVPYSAYPGAELFNEMQATGKVPPLSEEHFTSLLTHSDLSSSNSNNPHFTTAQIGRMRLGFLFLFYTSQYLFRPQRIFYNFRNIIRNDTRTRAEQTLRRLLVRVWRLFVTRTVNEAT